MPNTSKWSVYYKFSHQNVRIIQINTINNNEGKIKFYGKYLDLGRLSSALILNIFLTFIVCISCIEAETVEGRIY